MFIDKYKAFDVKTLTDAMKNMESTKTIPPEYLIRYAEYINLPRISLVMNLQDMLSMAMALKLNHDENMTNMYNDTTKRLLNDVTEIINKHEIYSPVYRQDHNDLISVEKMLRSEMKLMKNLVTLHFKGISLYSLYQPPSSTELFIFLSLHSVFSPIVDIQNGKGDTTWFEMERRVGHPCRCMHTQTRPDYSS